MSSFLAKTILCTVALISCTNPWGKLKPLKYEAIIGGLKMNQISKVVGWVAALKGDV